MKKERIDECLVFVNYSTEIIVNYYFIVNINSIPLNKIHSIT